MRVPSSWQPAVWPVRWDEADWGCSPRSWPKVAVRWRTAVRQASARALARAAAGVGPASREARERVERAAEAKLDELRKPGARELRLRVIELALR